MPATHSRVPKLQRTRPSLIPSMCKACGRCIEACPKDCIQFGGEIDPATGLTPVVLDLKACNACGLCIEACPEPYGLLPADGSVEDRAAGSADRGTAGRGNAVDPADLFGPRRSTAQPAESLPDREVPMPRLEPMVLKGTHAAALGAVFAGCRHFFGYPITPSSEGAELLAGLLPALDGHFVQAVSEVAAVNMMYGCGAGGQRTLTFTSSPGFSLMLEGISYMIGYEIPGVIVNIMRGGPGLGNIGPEQADIKLVCRGLGHGETHAVVLAPSTPQEMLDLGSGSN